MMRTMPPALDEPGRRAVVTPLRRPPVRQSVVVRAPLRRTFDTFVRTIGAWWPVQPFSSGKDRVRAVTVERRRGGRVFETWADGTEVTWGELLTWEPPERFVMTWTMTPAATEVELMFAALGPRLTRVTVEHRGWEALTEEQLGEDCALPGGYTGGSYAAGWALILGRLGAVLGLAAPGPDDGGTGPGAIGGFRAVGSGGSPPGRAWAGRWGRGQQSVPPGQHDTEGGQA